MPLFPADSTLDDKVQLSIIFLLRVSTAAALGYSISLLNVDNIINASIGLVLLFAPEFIKRRYNVKLPVEYDFAIVLFIFGGIILGEVGEYYTRFFWWDDFLHTTSGVLLGFAGFVTLYALKLQGKLKASRFVISFFAFSLAVTFGVLWEVFEFTLDQTIGTNLQNGSLIDTMVDLIVDSIGALFSVILGYRFMAQPQGEGMFARMVHNFIDVNPRLKKRR